MKTLSHDTIDLDNDVTRASRALMRPSIRPIDDPERGRAYQRYLEAL